MEAAVHLVPSDAERASTGELMFWGALWRSEGGDVRLEHCTRIAYELFVEVESLDLKVEEMVTTDLGDRVELRCRSAEEFGASASARVLKCGRCGGLSHAAGPSVLQDASLHKPRVRALPDAGSHDPDCPHELVRAVLRA